MVTPMTTLARGTRVEYIGRTVLGVRPGEVGRITGVDGRGRYCVDFDSGPELVWPSEVREAHPEVLATLVLDEDRYAALHEGGWWEHYLWLSADDREAMALIAAGEYTVTELCQCGHTGADHCGETVMTVSTHRCVRCDCLMYEPPAQRFVVVDEDGRLTLEDRENGGRVQHAARWSPEQAQELADELNRNPQYRVVWDWTKGVAA